MSKKKRIVLTVIPIVIAVVLIISCAYFLRIKDGTLYVLDPSYSAPDPTLGNCMAMTRSCGVCIDDSGYGFREDNRCYVPLFEQSKNY